MPELLSEPVIAAIARAQLGFDIPDECLPGVVENLAILAEHARLIDPDRA